MTTSNDVQIGQRWRDCRDDQTFVVSRVTPQGVIEMRALDNYWRVLLTHTESVRDGFELVSELS